uniref:Protein kinase domain-containing protein n=1 Tax=Strigamia maritima TaxID=126957 RepID=T1J935_STRMM
MIRRPGSAVGSSGLYAVGNRTDPRPRVRQIGRYRLDQQLLGKGNFARVELATHTVLGLKVAIKIIDKAQITEDYVRRNLGREARIMARLRHPHIAALYEAIETGHLMCLVTELAPGGDLCSYVKAQTDGRLGEAAARPFLKQIVSALVYMHSRGVIHRDLKMENVMLDETKSLVKIVDFGLSNFYGPGVVLQTHCGSPEYAAPELFIPARPYGPEVDVWSLGVIMYGALTGCLPFLSPRTDGTNPQERRHRLYRKIQQGLGQQHWKALTNISSECRQLLLALLTASPDNRIKLSQVETHSYMILYKTDPPVDTSQPGLDHSLAPKVLIRMSELLSIPVSILKTEVECDDHCEVAAMFYLLLDSTKPSKPDPKITTQNSAMTSQIFSPMSSTTSATQSPRIPQPEREISPSNLLGVAVKRIHPSPVKDPLRTNCQEHLKLLEMGFALMDPEDAWRTSKDPIRPKQTPEGD